MGFQPEPQTLRQVILSCLEKQNPMPRQALLKKCRRAFGFSDRSAKEFALHGPLAVFQSKLSTELAQLMAEGILDETEDTVTLRKPVSQTVREEELRTYLADLLQNGSPMRKQQIFDACAAHFRSQSAQPVQNLHSAVGNLLAIWERAGILRKSGDSYTFCHRDDYPPTPLGGVLRDAANGADAAASLLHALNLRGGEHFEVFSAGLLQKYFEKSGITVCSNNVTGGADDGGVDIQLEIVDRLGFREKVFVQAKQRTTQHVTVKEVREFYGALYAKHGSRGIFITTSCFHKEAEKLIASLPDLVGVDGKKLCEMAEYCAYGLCRINGVLRLEESLLLP